MAFTWSNCSLARVFPFRHDIIGTCSSFRTLMVSTGIKPNRSWTTVETYSLFPLLDISITFLPTERKLPLDVTFLPVTNWLGPLTTACPILILRPLSDLTVRTTKPRKRLSSLVWFPIPNCQWFTRSIDAGIGSISVLVCRCSSSKSFNFTIPRAEYSAPSSTRGPTASCNVALTLWQSCSVKWHHS